MEGYYYWTYRSHPHSNEEFLYDGILYAQDSHTAHSMSKQMIREIDNKSVEYDLGVHLITDINHIVRDHMGIENIEDADEEKVRSDLVYNVREQITEEDILEVGDRQEKSDRAKMGEDVDGVIDVNLEK